MAEECKTAEQLAAEAAAQKAATDAAKIADDQRRRAEDDKTKSEVVPVGVTDDDSTVRMIGLFFNMTGGFREEDEPESGLVIEKDVLDRNPGVIFGAFDYDVDARAKIVYRVFLDGKEINSGGQNLTYGVFKGRAIIDLFKYPNTARSNKDGIHRLHIVYGVITGIVEGNTKGKNEGLGLTEAGKVQSVSEADFTIKLLPHKILD